MSEKCLKCGSEHVRIVPRTTHCLACGAEFDTDRTDEVERLRAIVDMLVPIFEAAVRAKPNWSPVHDTAEVPMSLLSEAAEAAKEKP